MNGVKPGVAWGIDIGSEFIKLVVISKESGGIRILSRRCIEHRNQPLELLSHLLEELEWNGDYPIAVTGRLSRSLTCLRIPTKAALARGVRFFHPDLVPGTVISMGSQGFSVLELHENGKDVLRENSRCSQGTGNFLSQLVGRFGLTVQEASELCRDVAEGVPLSGRCPVILKTDMTHLANKGEDRGAIVAGLYDAVCENVQALVKPGLSPSRAMLSGGVSLAPRVRRHFERFLLSRGMELQDTPETSSRYLEATGAALIAMERNSLPDAPSLVAEDLHKRTFEKVPSLREGLPRVRRLPVPETAFPQGSFQIFLGFDIGSTGSKAVGIDAASRVPVWEAYLDTQGDPVTAAQRLVARYFANTEGKHAVSGIGVTGSGREIVGSLLRTCYGVDPVLVLNEIAAHAEGALYYDARVDTIFEIGGQDAKYSRLENGNIIDAAMNEACSAGTGSFLAEQGRCFEGIADVVQMNEVALQADYGVSLGQHCSVFMAEVIADAVAEKVPQQAIIAGLYDSIAQNYLNRVKGSRSVGECIFCQGMPFNSDALAAAIARQTGRDVVVPPNPGTMGALGIALIAQRELPGAADLDLNAFLDARVLAKDTFVCVSNKGCGGAGNKCRIDRIETLVGDEKKRFMWGGGCSLYSAGGRGGGLPDNAPDPFRERRELIRQYEDRAATGAGKTVGLVEEFALKGLLPFFLSFFAGLGLRPKVISSGRSSTLKRGIEGANVPFCAPMTLYMGAVRELLEQESPDYLFLPRVRELPRQKDELHSVTCPIMQASPDLIRTALHQAEGPQLLVSRVDFGAENLDSDRFRASVRRIARELGLEAKWEAAYERACRTQREFDDRCLDMGRRALNFAREHGLPAVVVIGRNYTIHNDRLNSNVPLLLREQGAMPVPLDCYPIAESIPCFPEIYWGSSQLILRAAHQIAQTQGQYAVYCSNYSCGPDSFSLHFFEYLMEHKPFAIIETDGHTGDAGTKTRLEAFLYCVEGDGKRDRSGRQPHRSLADLRPDQMTVLEATGDNEILLVPRMGPAAEGVAALLRAYGVQAEALPPSSKESFRLGQQFTSGKECAPMTVTLGSVLDRIRQSPDPGQRFAYLMPSANGPCRFGVYNLLQRMILDGSGLQSRIRIVSPSDENYFAGVPLDFQLRTMACFTATDVLLRALHDARPVETVPGEAQRIYDNYYARMLTLLEDTVPATSARAAWGMLRDVFGLETLLCAAAEEFAAIKDARADIPTVAVVGEIYMRLDDYANGHVIEELERRGLRCVLAPFNEWLIYCTDNELQRFAENRELPGDSRSSARISKAIKAYIINRLYRAAGRKLGWHKPHAIDNVIKAAVPYLDPELVGEAVLSLGSPAEGFRLGEIDGVVAVGPHECMPNKIVESQLLFMQEKTGGHTLTVSVSGEPINPDILDRFAFEVRNTYEN
ncbi:acyl-CoA dehydratase activase-related protein [uncultured Pseudodesulfovibrio sp.]|uniref:acyl-CoA dehydratase activase-related protein n=1 Tax=uncultured Pseudodesulfovibrio sp. TaxID=2035858 RepID=UPI0029C6CFE7|nr:acyl-CoA dehydratase activase-related protein [uncultured Pseudodesulfovibrio sp.]